MGKTQAFQGDQQSGVHPWVTGVSRGGSTQHSPVNMSRHEDPGRSHRHRCQAWLVKVQTYTIIWIRSHSQMVAEYLPRVCALGTIVDLGRNYTVLFFFLLLFFVSLVGLLERIMKGIEHLRFLGCSNQLEN